MKRRLITVMLFALTASLACSTVLYKIVAGRSQRSVPVTAAHVFVAAKDLEAGTLVSETDLRAIEMPDASTAQWIRTREEIVGRGLLEPVHKDEPFTQSRLAERGAGGGLAARIPAGFRAVAVRVDDTAGLSGLITTGSHVDVISNITSGGPTVAGTHTILQNVEVLSAGDRGLKDRFAGPPSVTLLATPQQAEILSMAVAQGRIDLELRNPLDAGNFISSVIPPNPAADAPTAVARRVFHRVDTEMAKAAREPKGVSPAAAVVTPPATVEIIHGTKRVVSVVGATNPGANQPGESQ
jgi:pilus assembly protein CpaB